MPFRTLLSRDLVFSSCLSKDLCLSVCPSVQGGCWAPRCPCTSPDQAGPGARVSCGLSPGTVSCPPPATPPRRCGHACAQAMPGAGLCCPQGAPVCVPASLPASIYGDPAEGYLLFNLFVGVLSRPLCWAPGAGGGWLCVDPSGTPASVGGRTCTVANLRGVGDRHPGLAPLGVGVKLLTLYSLLVGSGSWGAGEGGRQSRKPLIYFSSCFCGPGSEHGIRMGFFPFKSKMSGNHIFYTSISIKLFCI